MISYIFRESSKIHRINNGIKCRRSKLKQLKFDSLFSFGAQSKIMKPIVSHQENNEVHWNFSLFDSNKTQIDCVIVQNNTQINLNWFKKAINQTKNILLADGGANVFYQNGYRQYSKVKGIIGDLDSLKQSVKNDFQSHGVPVILDEDQNKNDYQKTIQYAIHKLNYKNFFVFGALGGRFDHTLATMSISQKLAKYNSNIHIVLIGESNVICLLRGGFKHRIFVSKDIDEEGSGLISFMKVENVETEGFQWNLGKDYQFNTIQWGSFVSTSNKIVEKQLTVYTPTPNGIISFVSHFDFNGKA